MYINPKLALVAGMALLLSSLSWQLRAQSNSPDLEHALKDSGWSVERSANGDLILISPDPAPPRTTTGSSKRDMEKLAAELEAAGWTVQHKSDGSIVLETRQQPSETSDLSVLREKDQWHQLQQTLQSVGWSARREPDGSLHLFPPLPENTELSKSDGAGNSNSSEDNAALHSMHQKLRNTGWKVTNNPDGSVLLYPPGKEVTNKAHPCPGIVPTVTTELPVDSWLKAHTISRSWLDNQAIPNAAVGKIRQIFNIYLVSIVSKTPPFELIQQVAIRNSDGHVIVLN